MLPSFCDRALAVALHGTPGGPLDLRLAPVQQADGGAGARLPVTNAPAPANLPWSSCLHIVNTVPAWWMVDLLADTHVGRVVLYASNSPGTPSNRLENVDIYFGGDASVMTANALVATGVDVPKSAPKLVPISASGRYLWLTIAANVMTLCAIEVYDGMPGLPPCESL